MKKLRSRVMAQSLPEVNFRSSQFHVRSGQVSHYSSQVNLRPGQFHVTSISVQVNFTSGQFQLMSISDQVRSISGEVCFRCPTFQKPSVPLNRDRFYGKPQSFGIFSAEFSVENGIFVTFGNKMELLDFSWRNRYKFLTN